MTAFKITWTHNCKLHAEHFLFCCCQSKLISWYLLYFWLAAMKFWRATCSQLLSLHNILTCSKNHSKCKSLHPTGLPQVTQQAKQYLTNAFLFWSHHEQIYHHCYLLHLLLLLLLVCMLHPFSLSIPDSVKSVPAFAWYQPNK